RQESSQARVRAAELGQEVARLASSRDASRQERDREESALEQQRAAVAGLEAALAETEARLAVLRAGGGGEGGRQGAKARQAARLQNDASAYRARLDDKQHERDRLQHRRERAAEHLASLDTELDGLVAAEEALLAQLAAAREAQAARRDERDRLTAVRDDAAQRAATLRARRSGLVSRLEVLENLERSHEGLGTGVRQVFARVEAPGLGRWGSVVGIVAEALTVRREFAPLIDLALGERAQRFLVADMTLLDEALRQRAEPFSGRVSFLPLSEPGADAPLAVPDHPGVIAPAEQLVRCDDAQFAGLPARLLGRTLIVRDLETARDVVASSPGHRCITLAGELVDADGTLTVGTHLAEAGILSRKSELRELREQLAELDRDAEALDADLDGLRTRLEELEAVL